MGEKTDRGIKDATKFLGNMFKKDDGAEAAANDGGNANAPAGSTPSAKPSASANKPATNLAHGFTDKQAHYREVPWSNLPLSARKANKVIGYDKAMWDAGTALPVDTKAWTKLPAFVKTACTTLGWDEVSWDAKYQGTAWSQLPAHVQRAAETLGWSEKQWDADSRANVALTAKGWGGFTEEEKRCLHVMGYYVHNWGRTKPVAVPVATAVPAPAPRPVAESDPEPVAEPAAAPSTKEEGNFAGFTDREAHYEDVKWSKLNLAQRKAAKDLDYDKASWDKQTWCEIDDWHWWDLEDWHKKAVATLGWTEGAWEHYAHGSWGDMPDHARRAATTLGWTEEKWDDDWGWGDVCHKDWRKLSKEEQRCLHVLGYYKLTWGGYESGSESESSSSESESSSSSGDY